MDGLTLVRVAAIVCAGLLAGIYLGHRTGAHYALPRLDRSSFVQFQQVVHTHYVKFMPPLVLAALLATVIWIWLIRAQWKSPGFWLLVLSACGIAFVAAITRAVNVPLNNQLMTWDVADPPPNLAAIWAPWDSVNTIRTFVSVAVLILETTALSLK